MDVQAILIQIAETAAGDGLNFPTTTEMALKVQRLLARPARHAGAGLPLLATLVVAVANSVIYNHTGRAITDPRNAVSRVGFYTLRVLATVVVVRRMESMARTLLTGRSR